MSDDTEPKIQDDLIWGCDQIGRRSGAMANQSITCCNAVFCQRRNAVACGSHHAAS